MESAQKAIRMIFNTSVRGLTEEVQRVYLKGVGESATFEDRSKGWFIHLTGSNEAIHVGYDKPNITVGAAVKVIIEVANAESE